MCAQVSVCVCVCVSVAAIFVELGMNVDYVDINICIRTTTFAENTKMQVSRQPINSIATTQPEKALAAVNDDDLKMNLLLVLVLLLPLLLIGAGAGVGGAGAAAAALQRDLAK